MASNTLYEVTRKCALAISARPVRFCWPGGVVSFTFDDFPKSALTVGGRILERYDARGTYYTAMNLAGANEHLGPMFDPNDVLAAHRGGHEIACHTFTHVDCRTVPASSLTAELHQNAQALGALSSDIELSNFAYPYGSISASAKRFLSAHFSSCRGIGRGVNHEIVDLADLQAVQLYALDFDEAEMQRLIQYNKRVEGWLIFFTHDVSQNPSAYGCTPDQLERTVAFAAAHTTILPVRDVTSCIRRPSLVRSLTTKSLFALKKLENRFIKSRQSGSSGRALQGQKVLLEVI
jgi:peptidoglycan/xylan/chitin deacetylase (PgdA/CDA1 family)